MLKNRFASSAIAVAGGLFASGALANTGEQHASQTGETGHPKQMGQMDHQSQDVSFEKLDQNGDGYISQSEFDDSEQKLVDHEMLDTDNDGRINRTEFAAFEQMSQDQSSDQRSETEPAYRSGEPFQSTDPTRDTDRERDY